MCIIVTKPAGEEFPTWETLEACWDNNPDGAGYMYNSDDGRVHWVKGFMTWLSFKKALRNLKNRINQNTTVVMHFRIQTHGGVIPECTHPFPMSDNLDDLKKLEGFTELGLAHNGIINGRATDNGKSDTMDYIQNFLFDVYQVSGLDNMIHNPHVANIIDNTIGYSRFCLINGQGEYSLVGDWIEDNGIYYSNRNYTPYQYKGWYGHGKYQTTTSYKGSEESRYYSPTYTKRGIEKVSETYAGWTEEEWQAYIDDYEAEYDELAYGDKIIDVTPEDVANMSEDAALEFYTEFINMQPHHMCTACAQYGECISECSWACTTEEIDDLFYELSETEFEGMIQETSPKEIKMLQAGE